MYSTRVCVQSFCTPSHHGSREAGTCSRKANRKAKKRQTPRFNAVSRDGKVQKYPAKPPPSDRRCEVTVPYVTVAACMCLSFLCPCLSNAWLQRTSPCMLNAQILEALTGRSFRLRSLAHPLDVRARQRHSPPRLAIARTHSQQLCSTAFLSSPTKTVRWYFTHALTLHW